MWLYLPPDAIPSTSSPSAPASVDSNSDCNSLTVISDRLCEASVTWRGKLEPSPAWLRRWKRGGFILRLSGLTLEPSTADRFADAWISSLRATRAKETALLESAAVNSTIDGCSIAPSTFSIKAGLQPSSAKTCRGTRTGSLPSLSQHWSDWAAALRSEYSARPKPEIRCAGSGSSSWPSARTSDTLLADLWMAPNVPNGGRSTAHAEKVGNTMYHEGKKVQLGLESQASNWASPKASDPEKAGPNMRGSKGDIPLPAQAMQWLAPLVADAGEKITLASHQGSLLKQANDFRPPSSPDQPIIAGGSTSSTAGPNSNQPSVKRKLNPFFVEALMRWPTGLSGFVRAETGLTLWQQHMGSYVSTLFSAIPDPQQQEMF